MDFHISLVGRSDLAGEIYRQMRRAIVERRLRPGDPLPSSRELARRLRVSRTTVSAAYDRLAGDNLVTSRLRSGTFVSPNVGRVKDLPKAGRHAGVLRPRALWDTVELSTAFARQAQIDFRTGVPDASLFPHGRWRRAVASAYREEMRAGAAYADPAGDNDLRECIAHHIGIARGVEAFPDDVMVTAGAQQAIDVVSRVLLAPGDSVAVEDPGYAPPRRLFASLGARVVGVPVDEHGLVVDALPGGARVAIVTPSHQYPLGVSMALPRRIALLEWAELHDAAIIEDDYDSEFRFGGRPLEPLHTLDRRGRVIYVGTFSKSLLPALRVGFVVTPPSLSAAMRKAKQVTDWHTSMIAQRALARFMLDGTFARHMRRMSRVYSARHALTTRTFDERLGDRFQLLPSDTGLHVAAIARELSVAAVDAMARRASGLGVEVQTLSQFAVGRTARAGLVLGYGGVPTQRIVEGISTLARCVRAPVDTGR